MDKNFKENILQSTPKVSFKKYVQEFRYGNITSLMVVVIACFIYIQGCQIKKINKQLKTTIVNLKNQNFKPARVDFDAYESLVQEVRGHRKSRLLNLDEFLKMSKDPDVYILDTRSDIMYNQRHITGAIHLNFSDFTQNNLTNIIPDKNSRILIYCNNNFDGDEIFFATKMTSFESNKRTLALNIPTYINLYGYGYRNVFELSELVSVWDQRISFSGTMYKKAQGD